MHVVLPLRSSRHDPPEDPIRSELFGIERLEQHAASLAAAQPVTRGIEPGRPLLARTEENGRVLREAHRSIAEAIREEHSITPAAEWLVDNFFVVDEQLREIRDDLPASFYRELPKLADGPLTGFPRVYGIAWAFVAHTDSRVDPDTLRRFVRAYQGGQPLAIGELWALTISLRVVLVENLRRLAEAIVSRREARREADALADDLVGHDERGARLAVRSLPRSAGAPLDAAFAVELLQRLRDHDPAASPALSWLRERLAAQGTSPEEIALVEHQRQAATTVTVRNVITSMRLMSSLDWTAFFESVSLVDEALCADSNFAAMDFVSRDRYRHAIERLARGSRHTELEVARAALAAAAHARDGPPQPGRDDRWADPGFHLVGGARRAFERSLGFRPKLVLRLQRAFLDAATPGYLGTLLLLTVLVVALPLALAAITGTGTTGLIVLGLLAVIPASDLAVALVNRAVTALLPPGALPRLEWAGGVPAECRSLVVVPTLLASLADVDEHVDRLEVHALANADGDVRFAILSDWPDAPTEHVAGDDEIVAAARAGIAGLNARHGSLPGGGTRFLLFHRRRLWNASEGAWMGWERKRGKLHELNRLLRGATDTSFLAEPGGITLAPDGVRYVVTLDADTRLPIGAVRRLVGAMAHPLNRPRVDPVTRRVVEGYAVLQPRVTAPLPGRRGSVFQWLSSGMSGIDPYAAAVSDVYQDLFGEGSYTGKGIYDVDAFEAALADRVPENALLSHDLFEGLFARAGLLSDTEFFEVAPAHYLVAAARQHRWARGDWQLLPWILGERLSVIGRWKMIDNLRRTLSAPAAVLTLVAGWVWPGSLPPLWTVFVLAVLAIPALLPVLAGVLPRGPGISRRSHLRAVGRDFGQAAAQFSLTLVMLADRAVRMGDAILRTLVRLAVTRRNLLEWVPSMQAASRVPNDLAGFCRRIAGGVVVAAAGAVVVACRQPAAWPVAAPILALWFLAPWIALQISLPGRAARAAPLEAGDARTLRLIARRTWRYFTTFVTPESRALPPDNFQETPQPVVAERTSPTNIALYLLSAVAARDFGWIGTLDLVDRLEATLQSVAGLQHHRGHLFNWYDTRDGRPLEPRYVSSVDSGNLAGALLTLGNACRELIDRPVPGAEALSGIADSALLLGEAARAGDVAHRARLAERRRFDAALDVVLTVTGQTSGTPAAWAGRLSELESAARTASHCARDAAANDDPQLEVLAWAESLRAAVETHARDLDTLMPWARLHLDQPAAPALADLLDRSPSLAELPARCEAALREMSALRPSRAAGDSRSGLRQLDALAGNLERSAAAAGSLIRRLEAIADRTREMVRTMEFGFLFDPVRQLFAIGCRLPDGSLDPGRYDLLASESRVLSFVAIAKGDVPVRHWFRLGRPLTPVGTDSVLMSWSGSMFEYLMPRLIMHAPAGSLLEQTCRLVVRRQIEYGAERGVPWGISESGYAVRDLAMTYQYSNFGVPGLGLRRGLGEDLVIAPYATALAAMVEPREAVRGFAALSAAGADGRYGFHEALDYTASRLPAETGHVVVRMFMAHHQGMAIVALGNVLHGGAMRARFHAEPIVRATELLLQERTPRDVAVARPQLEGVPASADVREAVPPQVRRFTSPHGAVPRTQLLSNGRYAVMITAAGSGSSRWRDLAVTRWREDATRDDTGTYVFLRDIASGELWSAGFQPSGAEPEECEITFSEDRAEFHRRDGAMETRLEVIVSPEDDAELRRVSLVNTGTRTREIEVTSYAEIVLAPPAADAAHPAFSRLFVQTECLEERDTLLATRRPRSPDEAPIWMAHVLAVEGETIGNLEWETDRAQFLGRGRGVRSAHAVTEGRVLSGTVGAVLDPVVSLRRRVRVRPGRTVRLVFSTLVAGSRVEALDLADKYRDVTTFERAAMLAWTQAQVQLHHLAIGADEAHLFQTLGGSILHADRGPRAPAEVLARQAEGPAALWSHGISGDFPIVLVEIDEADDVGIVRQLLRAHEYWRMKRLAVDLVIMNDRAPSYVQDLQTLLETLVRTNQAIPRQEGQESRGGVFILQSDRMPAAHRDALASVARVVLSSRRGTLAAQIARAQRPDAPPVTTARPARTRPAPLPPPGPLPELGYFNGLGGFSPDGREYVIVLRAGQWTPAPWINVIANRDFGFLASEAGSGCTWSVNSQENQLTTWSNDPVSDPPGEAIYVRDDDSGEVWTPTPLPVREDGEYVVRHGQGYSSWAHEARGIALELLQFVPVDDPVKVSRLVLVNHSPRSRRLTVTACVEWVLGVNRSSAAPFVITERDAATGALFARNSWSRDFGARIAFVDLGGAQTAFTADRTEFFGRNGSARHPAALLRRQPLSGRTGAGFDPCGALLTTIELRPGARAEVVLLLGQAGSREQAQVLIRRWRSADLDEQLRLVVAGWDEILQTVQVTSPDPALDLLLNRWLLYQTLSCRLRARAAFYQAGGAYGFRDQLQDVMALAVSRPDLLREHLLKAASRQFVEGDVQHWWHEPAGRGVRTRISDDLLWLPWVAHHAILVAGDRALLDEEAPFLEGAQLAAGQNESYFEPRVSPQRASLYEHCARAIERSLAVGTHGLPLMGTGDWNDGMNLVGAAGRGESVWLAWFLHAVLVAWAPIARERGEARRAEAWSAHAAALAEAVERAGWDGDWYRRAYFDDGTPLGTAGADACAIDSIAQSWSVLSGGGDPGHARRAMESLDRHLVRRNDRLILLLTPPFDDTRLQPGYIKGYVPGVRENGGQYTHAAAWCAMAFAALGDGERTAELLAIMNPIGRASSPAGIEQYKVEPYVVAADVYSEPPHVGRGGWTWYTGSAAWMYRAGIESLLGFRLRGRRLEIDPCVPARWPGFRLVYRHRSAQYDIAVENPDGVCRGVAALELDGAPQEDRASVPLADDGRIHRVRVVLGDLRRLPDDPLA